MTNSDNKQAPKIIYTISNELMLQFIAKLPTFIENNKHTEFMLQVKTNDGNITDNLIKTNSLDKTGSIEIRFSYDFVQDRWFLNDNKVDVVDRLRS